MKKVVVIFALVCALSCIERVEASAYFKYPVFKPDSVKISMEIFANFIAQIMDSAYHDFWRAGIVKELNRCRN